MYVQCLTITLALLILPIENIKAASLSELLPKTLRTLTRGYSISSGYFHPPLEGIWPRTLRELKINPMEPPPCGMVRIVENGPRDNLQNLQDLSGKPIALTPKRRIEYIKDIVESARTQTPIKIDTGSFVSPKAIPQMAESNKVLKELPNNPFVSYSFIVPNRKGLADLLTARSEREDNINLEAAVIVSASEIFSKANIGCSVWEGVTKALGIVGHSKLSNLGTRVYISMAFGDPRGSVEPGIVLKIAKEFNAIGCAEIVLCDTAGIATPSTIFDTCSEVASVIFPKKLALHLHVHENELEKGLENVIAGLLARIRTFDAGNLRVDSKHAVIKGCPYSPGAPKNIPTAPLVWFITALGMKTNWERGKVRNLNLHGLELD